MSSGLNGKADPGLFSGPTPKADVFKRVIPCLDVDAGRVVKGSSFVDLDDAGDPIELAVRYDEEGADEVVFLDITATSDKRKSAVELARRAADNVFIPFTVGGGVRDYADAQAILDAGADKVAVNSAAVENPDLISDINRVYAKAVLVVSIDAKRRPDGDGWDVFTSGGRLNSGRDVVEWVAESAARGAGEILLTSIDRDGTKKGYDLELIRSVTPVAKNADDAIQVIASGGAGEVRHLVDAFAAGADAVLAASIFHYRELEIAEVKRRLRDAGVYVRL
jgi:imidazole glycerol-phosphate synthase subunit HisF